MRPLATFNSPHPIHDGELDIRRACPILIFLAQFLGRSSMGAFHLRMRRDQSAVEMLSDLPERAKAFLKDGFQVLTSVYDKNSSLLAKVAIESVRSQQLMEEPVLAETGLAPEQSRQLLGTLNFVALLLSSTAEPAENIADALVKSALLGPQQQSTAVNLIRLLRQSTPSLKQIVAQTSLASEVLPSLTTLEFAVDIRLRFEDEGLLAVPVLVAHIDTDSSHGESWFQMTKGQAERLIGDFKNVLAQMEQAEKLIERGIH